MARIRTSALGAVALAALAACSTDAPTNSATAVVTQGSLETAPAEDPIAPGRILVKFNEGVDGTSLMRKHGLTVRTRGGRGSFDLLNVARGSEREVAARLSQEPGVEYAQPDFLRQVHTIDGRLWAFFNPGGMNMSFFNDPNGATGFIPSSYAAKADADEDAIEGIGAGGSPVVISSLDTGVDFANPEFTGRLIKGCDWYSQTAAGNSSATCTDFTPDDTPDEGHGTHTTGTMAGATVGVAGVTGAAANVKVLVQRVCGPNGCYTSAVANAIRAAADYPGMVAMNLSLGGGTLSTVETNAIAYATSKNVLVIASSGNSGTAKVACPACDANAISVGATLWTDVIASYSQYGKGLDIVAPGGECYSNTTEEGCIFSTIVTGYTGGRTYTGTTPGAVYGYMQGTSMAAPQVTGAAAVVASKTGLRGAALRARLESSADDRGTAGYDTKFGNGRLNVYRAVTGSTLGAGL